MRRKGDDLFSPLPDGRIRLDQPFHCTIKNLPNHEHRIIVPAGFISDGASIPKSLWWLVGPPIASNHLIPSVVHDYLCDTATNRNERLIGDAVFRLLLEQYHVPPWKQRVMFVGVMLQGRFLWAPKMAAGFLLAAMLISLLGAACSRNQFREHTPLPEPRIVIGSCKFVRAKDADTYVISVTRLITVRANDCWAPETHNTRQHVSEKTLGLEALASLQTVVSPGDACRLEVLPDGDEHVGDSLTFGRVVGSVYLESGDGRSLGQITNDTGLTFATKAELESYLDERDTDERFVQ